MFYSTNFVKNHWVRRSRCGSCGSRCRRRLAGLAGSHMRNHDPYISCSKGLCLGSTVGHLWDTGHTCVVERKHGHLRSPSDCAVVFHRYRYLYRYQIPIPEENIGIWYRYRYEFWVSVSGIGIGLNFGYRYRYRYRYGSSAGYRYRYRYQGIGGTLDSTQV